MFKIKNRTFVLWFDIMNIKFILKGCKVDKFILLIGLLLFQSCFANSIEASFNLPSKDSLSNQYFSSPIIESSRIKGEATIKAALELIKISPYTEIYDIISGKNPTQKPVIIEYKNLELIDSIYKNLDSLGWKKKKQLFIYINTKHYDAPPEAIAALIAGRVLNVDEYDSINEEIYCWCVEGAFWTYFTLKKPELMNSKQSLVVRENLIKKLLEKGNYTETYIRKLVLSHKGYEKYHGLPDSPGFSDEELSQKLSKLFKSFNFQQQITIDDKSDSM